MGTNNLAHHPIVINEACHWLQWVDGERRTTKGHSQFDKLQDRRILCKERNYQRAPRPLVGSGARSGAQKPLLWPAGNNSVQPNLCHSFVAVPRPPPPCDIPSGCCSLTGPWTVSRSSLRMLCRSAAFCRPRRPVLLLVSFPRSRSPVVGVPGLCCPRFLGRASEQRHPSPTIWWLS